MDLVDGNMASVVWGGSFSIWHLLRVACFSSLYLSSFDSAKGVGGVFIIFFLVQGKDQVAGHYGRIKHGQKEGQWAKTEQNSDIHTHIHIIRPKRNSQVYYYLPYDIKTKRNLGSNQIMTVPSPGMPYHIGLWFGSRKYSFIVQSMCCGIRPEIINYLQIRSQVRYPAPLVDRM